ncbi:MAG: hypothetical protein LBB67_02085 [Oscillospiraceae bacterium]|jgi:hypothetical protein|nr:hypothetical protein [Oscillospiraceae bacterium]
MKKLLAIVLACILLVSGAGVGVSAESGSDEGYDEELLEEVWNYMYTARSILTGGTYTFKYTDRQSSTTSESVWIFDIGNNRRLWEFKTYSFFDLRAIDKLHVLPNIMSSLLGERFRAIDIAGKRFGVLPDRSVYSDDASRVWPLSFRGYYTNFSGVNFVVNELGITDITKTDDILTISLSGTFYNDGYNRWYEFTDGVWTGYKVTAVDGTIIRDMTIHLLTTEVDASYFSTEGMTELKLFGGINTLLNALLYLFFPILIFAF